MRLNNYQKETAKMIKRANTRLTALYEAGQKAGDMSAYNKAIEPLMTKEMQSTGLLHKSDKGVLQAKQAGSNYSQTGVTKLLADVLCKVPTLGELAKKAKEKLKESFKSIQDFVERGLARYSAKENIDSLNADSYDKLYEHVREQYEDDDVVSDTLRKIYDAVGTDEDGLYNYDELLREADRIWEERENEWKSVTGGDLPFTDY